MKTNIPQYEIKGEIPELNELVEDNMTIEDLNKML